ncbi:MAG: methylmalonyl-CoA mutase, partial [Christensenellaceae bacterium]|nr:methylmalonyl-CoA mutase [Christensenellaceae bacterium]
MRPNFKDIKYTGSSGECCIKEHISSWNTPEKIEVKSIYTEKDLEGMEHLGYAAGIPPYLRGPYSTMYVMRPWTIR